MQSLNIIPALPVSIPVLMGFIAYLHNDGYAPASIITTVSAISYFHKINGFADPARNFLISKLLTGAQNLRSVSDVRLPVTLPILAQLIRAVPVVFTSHYKRLMLRAMMVLAFKAYLRVGEMVPRTTTTSHNCLQLHDVTLNEELITVSFRHFKHSGRRGPQSLQINGAGAPDTSISPAAWLNEFLVARGTVQSNLFAYIDGTPMLRRDFDSSLRSLLAFCGLSSRVFKEHSFRIGAATSAALRGESDAQIRAAGRWASDAFRKYIRIA